MARWHSHITASAEWIAARDDAVLATLLLTQSKQAAPRSRRFESEPPRKQFLLERSKRQAIEQTQPIQSTESQQGALIINEGCDITHCCDHYTKQIVAGERQFGYFLKCLLDESETAINLVQKILS